MNNEKIISSILNKRSQEDSIKILTLPDVRQSKDYSCGASSLQAVLAYYGETVAESELINELGTNNKRGTLIDDLIEFVKKKNFNVDARKMSIEDLKSYISRNIPVIILIQAWSEKPINWKTNYDNGHYVVAIGYTPDGIIFEDPWIFTKGYLSNSELDERWHDKDLLRGKVDHFGIAIYGKPKKYKNKKIIHID